MFIKLIVIKWRLSDFFSDRSHIDAVRFVLTIKLYLLSWSERWMTIFGSSGEFQEAFFYHIASWKVDVCVIAFLNTVVSCSRLYPPTPLRLAFLPPLLNWSNSKGGPTRKKCLFRGHRGDSAGCSRETADVITWSISRRFFAFVVLKAKRLVSSYSTWNNWWKWVKRNFRIMKASYLWRLLR